MSFKRRETKLFQQVRRLVERSVEERIKSIGVGTYVFYTSTFLFAKELVYERERINQSSNERLEAKSRTLKK